MYALLFDHELATHLTQVGSLIANLPVVGGAWCEGLLFCRERGGVGAGVVLLLVLLVALRAGCLRKDSRRRRYTRFRRCSQCQAENPGIASFCSRCGRGL